MVTVVIDIQGGPKSRTVLRVDNFATVSDEKVCDMPKVSKFFQKKMYKVWMLVKLNIVCI